MAIKTSLHSAETPDQQNLKEKIKDCEFFIIAEIGLNHNGSFGNAIKLIQEAKKAGVNAVKFQLHISDKERMKNAPTPEYFVYETRDEYFDRTAFSLNEWIKLKN